MKMTMRPLRIAMIGQRGLPATYGGVERHVEELGARLVAMGHEVTVYCRPNYSTERPSACRGMQLVYLPTPESKHFEAIVHSGAATRAAMRERMDIVHYHAVGPGLVAPLPRLFSSAKVVQTVHGLDQDRAKWGTVATAVLRLGCWMSARVPDATVVVSRALQRHYTNAFDKDSVYICNGVNWQAPIDAEVTLEQYGLEPGKYVLFVGRLVPEKVPDLLVRAFRRIEDPELRLVIAGSTSFTARYVHELETLAAEDPRVVMPGNVLRGPLANLYANAGVFVLPSDVEGMPLTLLEAASHRAPLVVSDIPPHRELLGHDRPGGRLFKRGDEDDLLRQLLVAIDGGEAERDGALRLHDELLDEYDWDAAAEQVDDLYQSVMKTPQKAPVAEDIAVPTLRVS